MIQPAMLSADWIAEDYHLTLQLSRAGSLPIFCPNAQINSMMHTEPEDARKQRSRWERDHVTLALRAALPLIGRGLWRRQFTSVALALELAVPPLAMLTMMVLALLLISGALAILGNWFPLSVGLIASGLIGLAVMVAWLRFGWRDVPLRTVLSVPGYALGKLPMYISVLLHESLRVLVAWRQHIAGR
jgi:cellulose synthase/poly-beta-1,6-N-acetylglucosamine synthase-like glycosyltransferase